MNFLPEETINQPDALGNVLQEMHKAYNKRMVPMSMKQSKHLIHLTLANDESIDDLYSDLSQHFPFNAFFARCDYFPIKYDKRLKLWLALLTHELQIGGMILVGYYIQWRLFNLREEYITVKNEIELGPVSLQTAIEKIFPFGVFDNETIHEFWDKQKVKGRPDNLVDHRSSQLSFMPEEITKTKQSK